MNKEHTTLSEEEKQELERDNAEYDEKTGANKPAYPPLSNIWEPKNE